MVREFDKLKFQKAYRYLIMQYNQLIYKYLGTLTKLLFLRLCMPSSNKQDSNQDLLISKSRFSKKYLSVPKLELVARHTAVNILEIQEQLCTDIQ